MSINLNISANNIELTDAIRSYVEDKVKSIEKLIDPEDTSASISVVVGKTTKHHNAGEFFNAEANLHIKGQDFHIVSEESDLYAAIDIMKDKLEDDVTSYKDKKITLVRKGARMFKNALQSLWPFE